MNKAKRTNNSRTQYLADVEDLLSLLNERSDLTESQKHFIVKKKLSLVQSNITVPKLGVIRFYKIFPGRGGGIEYYEIQDLKMVGIVEPFKIENEGIKLESVRFQDVTRELNLRKALRKLDPKEISYVPYQGEWITARFLGVINAETLSIAVLLDKKEALRNSLTLTSLSDEFGKKIPHGIACGDYFTHHFDGVDLIKVNLLYSASGNWVGEAKILTRSENATVSHESSSNSTSSEDEL